MINQRASVLTSGERWRETGKRTLTVAWQADYSTIQFLIYSRKTCQQFLYILYIENTEVNTPFQSWKRPCWNSFTLIIEKLYTRMRYRANFYIYWYKRLKNVILFDVFDSTLQKLYNGYSNFLFEYTISCIHK